MKVLPAWEERVCGWGGGDMELYQKYGDGGEAPGSRACVRIPEMLCLKVGDFYGTVHRGPWENGFGPECVGGEW